MVAPVTGPINESQSWQSASQQYACYRQTYRQHPPYNLTLPYEARGCQRTFSGPNGASANLDWNYISQIGGWDSWTPLTNRAYAKLKNKVSDAAQLGVAVAEWKSAYEMISNRSMQLLRFSIALSRGRFGDAAKILKMSQRPAGVSRHKSLGQNWLEYWFGWSASIGDIYSAIDVLQQPDPVTYVRAAVRETKLYELGTPYDTTNPTAVYPSYTRNLQWNRWEVERGVACGCSVKVSNANAFLANQLGLVNPAAIALELIPWSWLFGWFVNVQDVVESLTDFHGLTLSEKWTTYFLKGKQDYYDLRRYRWYENGHYVNGGGVFLDSKGSFYQVSRSSGLPTPILSVNPLHLSKSRAATAISLLLQHLGR